MSKVTCWTMRDGTVIRIREMTDTHLLNTIAMLERRAEILRRANLERLMGCFPNLNGEIAQAEAESQWEALWHEDNEDTQRIFGSDEYNALVFEADKRGLKRK